MKMVLPADDVIITHKITDANLLSTIRSKLNKPEGDITVADMKTITDINLSTLRYESISGLEYAVNLETLEILIISDSSPLDITPIGDLYNLKYLNLFNTRVTFTGASPIQNLTNLKYLNLNQSNHGRSGLSALVNLEELYIESQWLNISNLGFLSSMSKLKVLSLGYNSIESLSPLATLPSPENLTTLILNNNKFTDLSPLLAFTNLQSLDLRGSSSGSIRNISVLENLTQLETLKLDNNQITDISPLENLTALKTLTVANNYLNLTNGSKAINTINTLIGRGVNVTYAPQKSLHATSFEISAVVDGESKVDLSWTYIPDAVYEVTRIRNGKETSIDLGSSTTSYADTDVVPGVTYQYIIKAHIWQGDGIAPITIGKTVTVTMGGTKPKYTITTSAGEGGYINPIGTTLVTYGGSFNCLFTPGTGYRIAYVLVDGVNMGTITSYRFDDVTAPHSVHVEFERIAYDITASAGNGGTISPSGSVSVNQGASQTFTITPNVGYRIVSVLVDGEDMGAISSYTFEDVTGAHTISAVFERITHTITASAGNGGTISPGGVQYR